jgi:inorganic pyrophosphatase
MRLCDLPERVDVLVEVPRGGWVKRTAGGALDFVSPLPAPFNYGCVPDRVSGDGDPLDVVLLGPRRPRGHRESATVRAVVRFVDAGDSDDKVICSPAPLTRRDRWLVHAFFRIYGPAKGLLNRLRRRRGPTRMVGWEDRP